jgi:hypothetical protein
MSGRVRRAATTPPVSEARAERITRIIRHSQSPSHLVRCRRLTLRSATGSSRRDGPYLGWRSAPSPTSLLFADEHSTDRRTNGHCLPGWFQLAGVGVNCENNHRI